MPDELVELFINTCPECSSELSYHLGSRDGYDYFLCTNDECGETIKFDMQHRIALSYPAEENIDQEAIRFQFPDKKGNGEAI